MNEFTTHKLTHSVHDATPHCRFCQRYSAPWYQQLAGQGYVPNLDTRGTIFDDSIIAV